MTTASGLESQLGFATESAFGTYETPDNFLEFTSESLKLERERIDSMGIRAGRRVLHRWAAGVQRVTGDIELELGPQGSGTLLKHMFGGVGTSGASDPYTHTFTPGQLDDKSLTIQFNRPDIDGTDRVFSYLGCSVTSWELACAVNEYLKLTCSIFGSHEDTAQSLASATYPTGYSPFVFTQGSLTIAGGAYDIKEFTLTGDNGLATDRHFIQASNPERPKIAKEANRRQYGGTLISDFEDLTAYNRFVSGTEAALVLTFTQSASRSLVITCNVRFDGETPNVSGYELLEQSLPFVCTSGTSDAAAITAVLKNADATV